MLGNKYSWWAYRGIFSKKFCNEIIEHASTKPMQLGYTGGIEKKGLMTEEKKKKLFSIRNSNVAWLTDPWINMPIMGAIGQANTESGWNYHYDASEEMQFTKYGPNQFYKWHKDEWNVLYKQPHNKGKTRKLSAVVSLNDDYVGGGLQFQYRDVEIPHNEVCDVLKTPGSIVIFPAYVWHQVLPVTQGVRYSLVIWTIGDAWK